MYINWHWSCRLLPAWISWKHNWMVGTQSLDWCAVCCIRKFGVLLEYVKSSSVIYTRTVLQKGTTTVILNRCQPVWTDRFAANRQVWLTRRKRDHPVKTSATKLYYPFLCSQGLVWCWIYIRLPYCKFGSHTISATFTLLNVLVKLLCSWKMTCYTYVDGQFASWLL